MKRILLIHYAEIGLKRGNIQYFLDKLRKQLREKLQARFGISFRIRHSLRRFMIDLPDDFVEAEYVAVVRKIFGIKSFKFVSEGSIDFDDLGAEIWENLPNDEIAQMATFRVSVKRSMTLEMKSAEWERKLGAYLLKKGLELKVNLRNPDLVVNVEFLNGHGYFSFRKYPGPGGLSANSAGKLVALLSAGYDSPVAAYRMMRRGARVIFAHFHGYPYTDKSEIQQVKDLTKILSDYQFDTKLYLFPLGKFQKYLGTNLEVPARLRTILARRMMLRVAEMAARGDGAKGMITGDSLAQVASQTTDNLAAVHEASRLPLYQPLISFDKDEVVKLAREIGTEEISALPCKDTCTMFSAKKPELRAKLPEVLEVESGLEIEKWRDQIYADREVITF